MYVYLKEKSETSIKAANISLKKMGFTTELYNGAMYGAFVSMEQLKEDTRYMNEDPKGKNQSKHILRPITPEYLMSFFWMHLGSFVCKLSSMNMKEKENVLIMMKWLQSNTHLIDEIKSSHYLCDDIFQYIPEYVHPKVLVKTPIQLSLF